MGCYDENATDEQCTCAVCRTFRPGYPVTDADPCLRCQELREMRARPHPHPGPTDWQPKTMPVGPGATAEQKAACEQAWGVPPSWLSSADRRALSPKAWKEIAAWRALSESARQEVVADLRATMANDAQMGWPGHEAALRLLDELARQ